MEEEARPRMDTNERQCYPREIAGVASAIACDELCCDVIAPLRPLIIDIQSVVKSRVQK